MKKHTKGILKHVGPALVILLIVGVPMAAAATGDVLGQVVPTGPTGTGRGLAFNDSSALYYTIVGDTNVYKIDMAGNLIATIPTPSIPGFGQPAGGPLVWDGKSLWTINYGTDGNIVQFDESGTLISTCNIFAANPGHPAITPSWKIDYEDGLDWIPELNQLVLSGEVIPGNSVILIDTSCKIQSWFTAPIINSKGTSGVAWDGANLWHVNPYNRTYFQTDLTGIQTGISFQSTIGSEDLAYDTKTFAPKCALWGHRAASPNRMTAYEIPCGGQPTNNYPLANPGGPYLENEGSAIQFDSSASSDPDGDPLTYAWDFGDGSMGASGATPMHTYADNGIYTVTLTVTDTHGASKTASTTATVNNIPPTVNAGPGATINEGDTFSSSGSFSDPAPADSTETWTATVDYGDGSGIQPLTLSGKTFALSHTYVDNGVYSVTVTVTDNAGGKGSNTATVAVNNAAPTVTITGPAVGSIYAVNTPVTFAGTYNDPGTVDTHTAQWTFDSTTTPVQPVSGGLVSTSYTFTAAGIYLVKLTVTDKDGGVGTATTVNEQDAFVVIYDPNGGFVTGGGWVNSPAGAYVADPSLTGRANFGFVSKYQKGATVPTGETEFQFQAGNFNFHSTSYNWLVVAGAKAQYKGSGTINGAGNYGFILTAIDGAISGGGGTDKFRIKIVNKDNGAIVYDNQLNADDSADPTTVIQGGSIIIHS